MAGGALGVTSGGVNITRGCGVRLAARVELDGEREGDTPGRVNHTVQLGSRGHP
jgi:hypothetical protein